MDGSSCSSTAASSATPGSNPGEQRLEGSLSLHAQLLKLIRTAVYCSRPLEIAKYSTYEIRSWLNSGENPLQPTCNL